MSESNNITINSEEIMSSVSILDESLNLLESSLLPSISADFSNLQELGLFSEGLASLKSQIESLCTSNENLMSKITIHAEEFAQLESELMSLSQSYGSTYSAGSGGYGGSYSEIADIIVQEVSNGNSINNENVLKSINKMDSETQIKLVDFLNTNKDSETSIEQLLFDSSKSGMLLVLLKKFYGDSSENLEAVVSDSSSAIQKLLLEKLYSGENGEVTISSNSILSAKQFFIQIAKENNATVSELILEDKNKKLITDAVAKVYDGNSIGSYNISDDEIAIIRNAVDNVAKTNNVTADDVIQNSKYTSMLIGI